MCVYVCVIVCCMCVCVRDVWYEEGYTLVCKGVEVRGQLWASVFIVLQFNFRDRASSLGLTRLEGW